MNPIGGFFELELPAGGPGPHPEALALTSGRAALALAIEALQPAQAWVPFYACEALLAPFHVAGVPLHFYAVDQHLDPVSLPAFGPKDVLVYVDYFGLKRPTVSRLAERYGDRLIVDATQAFFEPAQSGVWTVYSARKFFGVPDGAYLYVPRPCGMAPKPTTRIVWDHLINRMLGRQAEAYHQYQQSEAAFDTRIAGMSVLSERLLATIDYETAAARRRDNFAYLAHALGSHNRLEMALPPGGAPMCYPFLPARALERARLFEQAIYVPSYWGECLERPEPGFALERGLAADLLPLPIDHRYTPADLTRVVDTLAAMLE